MTGHTQLAVTPRDRFLQAVQKELVAFEQREREFSKKERQERAAELQIPAKEFEPSQPKTTRSTLIRRNRGAPS